MPRRAASPAPSENEVDILGSLFADKFDRDDHNAKPSVNTDLAGFDVSGLLDTAARAGDGENGDDEAFIALQQAASFRKGSGLKSGSAKKSGGFQAMGRLI